MTRPIRVAIMSDLHLEFESRCRSDLYRRRRQNGAPFLGPRWNDVRDQGVDLVLLAGDLEAGATSIMGISYAEQVAEWLGAPVVTVAGNHEFYGRSRLEMIREFRRRAAVGNAAHFLENAALVLETAAGPVRILGCTLWTDFHLFGEDRRTEAMAAAAEGMNDFFEIDEADGEQFTPDHAAAVHEESRAWLFARLAEEFEGPTVVVTHHAPSPRSVPERYAADVLSAAYASDLEKEILALGPERQPVLWAHGHVHDQADYWIGGTRVVCQPRGYVGSEPAARKRVPRVLEVGARTEGW